VRLKEARMRYALLDVIITILKGAVLVWFIIIVYIFYGCGGVNRGSLIDSSSTDSGSDGDSDTVISVTPPESSPPDVDSASGEDAEACALVTHSNGIGQSWADCAPLGTWDEAEAISACEANATLTKSPPACVPNFCSGPSPVAICDVDVQVPGFCTCWTFAGPAAGHVLSHACDLGAGPANAACAVQDNYTWE